MNGRAFLITGDDQADRAGQVVGQIVQRRDEGGDRALHVHRAAAVEQVAALFGNERVAGPARPRWHDVEMPGKGEMPAAARGAPSEEIFDRTVRRIAGDETI